MNPSYILVLISILLFLILCLSSIFSPLNCFVPRPSYLVSYVAADARAIEIVTGFGYLALRMIAALKKKFLVSLFSSPLYLCLFQPLGDSYG